VAGGLFRWGVPLCVGLAKRWRPQDAADIVRHLDGALGDGGRVLDLGGGTGHFASLLAAELGRPVTVLDASAPMLRQAARLSGVEPVLGDAARMPFAEAVFDAVITFDALHHFVRADEALAEAARVLRPGGALVVGEFDPTSRPIRILAAAERLLGEPGRFFTPGELERLAARVGVTGASEAWRWGSYLFVGRKDGRS
jgi:demethylmenaquinone methyltransferase/2-methoxy-6-polyprenyl-1,4-benzoquinol methylase